MLGTTSTARTIAVQSTGTGSLQVSNIALTGPFNQANTCIAGPIAAGSSCTIQVTFTPTALGSDSGTHRRLLGGMESSSAKARLVRSRLLIRPGK